MANPFDQFDPSTGNPFDQFDTPTAKPHPAVDVAKTIPGHLLKGAAETVMLPLTGARLLKDASEAGFNAVSRGAYDYIADPVARYAMGEPQATPEDMAQRNAERAKFDQFSDDNDYIARGQDAVRGFIDDNIYKPQTGVGEYAGTVAEFATPGSAIGKGSTMAARAVGDVLLPATGSYIGGEMTGDSWWGEVLGALFGSGVSGLVRETSTAPQQAIRGSVNKESVTPQHFEQAKALQAEANRRGVSLSGQEALDAVTNGGTGLSNIARVVENSQPGATVARPYFAQRPDQINTAIDRSAGGIGPASNNPSVLGPRMVENAQGVLDDTARSVNDATRPFYNAAEPQIVPQAGPATPAFTASLERLRSDSILGPRFADAPDDSVAIIDAVTKDMNSRAQALSAPANAGFDPLKASVYTADARTARDTARAAVPDYDTALTEQARLRASTLQPVETGPVGRVAGVGSPTTESVGQAFLPRNPDANSVGETSRAAGQLATRDQGTFDGFMRQLVDNARNTANAEKGNQRIGTKFVDDIAGNDAQRQNLAAALGATSNGAQAADDFSGLLDVLGATRYRPNMGSNTQGNSVIQANMTKTPALTAMMSAPASAWNAVRDVGKTYWYGDNLAKTADMLYSPNSVQTIEDIVMGRILSGNPDSFVQNLGQRARQSVTPAAVAATQMQPAPVNPFDQFDAVP